jgi:hypothetical protein
MTTVVSYAYRVTWINDEAEEVNKHMQEWAAAGWELVSGCASTWPSSTGSGVTHTRYTMYWRRPVAESTN